MNIHNYDSKISGLSGIELAAHREKQAIHHESDPSGLKAHDKGAKLDSGKVRPSLIFSDMPRALLAVSEVATFGAEKYSDGGWVSVPDGIKRYTDAMDRHRLAVSDTDEQSGLSHAAHLAWNALARLELMLREDAKPNG